MHASLEVSVCSGIDADFRPHFAGIDSIHIVLVYVILARAASDVAVEKVAGLIAEELDFRPWLVPSCCEE